MVVYLHLSAVIFAVQDRGHGRWTLRIMYVKAGKGFRYLLYEGKQFAIEVVLKRKFAFKFQDFKKQNVS
jgi:hypothetical protein